jgi:hypothetical protein
MEMGSKQKWVKGVEACGGQWGAISQGEVLVLEATVAESLIRGGLAIEVDDQGEPVKGKKSGKVDSKPSKPADAS